MFSHAGAPLNHSLLTIHLFWSADCWRYLEDSCFHSAFVQVLSRMLSHSSHLIQPVQSLFWSNLFNGVSFEWALTHWSCPSILPDSSNLPGVTLKFFSKFDVRMSYHQSNALSKIFQSLFIIGSNFLIFIRSISTIHGGVSHRHSRG